MRAFSMMIAVVGVCGYAFASGATQSSASAGGVAGSNQTVKAGVCVTIDGENVLNEDVKRYAKVMMTLNMNKHRHTKVGKRDRLLYDRYCKNGAQLAINRAVVARYASEHGLTNTTDTLSHVIRKTERQYGVRSRKLKRWHNLADLKYMLGKDAPILESEITARATYCTVTNYILQTKPVEITDQMITNRLRAISDHNARMTATNAFVHARATNVWRKIVGKELTFEQAATNYSEDVYIADGCEWGTFSRDQLADEPAVLKLLPTLKVGSVTPPVESDGGLAVLRLDEIEEDKNFTFSRVFFRLPIFFDVETPRQARAYLREKAEKEQIQRELDAVKAKMKIVKKGQAD